ncbi:MAG: hypothetical protein EA382_19345 [Spirochaetaceae bacterium]|nr:MAG: hypothetical protein EA382_19345 [Spirochaetaceae bacterium]
MRSAPLPPVAVGDWVDDVEPATRSHVGGRHARIPDHRLEEVRRAYFASVMHVDEQVGRLVAALKASGLDRNTWIIVTSDHGEFLGDHHLFHKFMPLEPAARIPLVVRPPAGSAFDRAGSVSDAPVLLTDVMPTILDLASVTPPAGLDGVSLPRELLPPDARSAARRMLHIEHHGGLGAFQCLCDGRVKYIRDGISGREWHFDLVQDPAELHDLSAETDLSGFRERLVAILRPRDDGLVVGGQLATGVRVSPTAEWVRSSAREVT